MLVLLIFLVMLLTGMGKEWFQLRFMKFVAMGLLGHLCPKMGLVLLAFLVYHTRQVIFLNASKIFLMLEKKDEINKTFAEHKIVDYEIKLI